METSSEGGTGSPEPGGAVSSRGAPRARGLAAPRLRAPFRRVYVDCVDIPRKTQDEAKRGINLKWQEQSFTRRVGLVFLLMTFQYVYYVFHCSYWFSFFFSGETHPHTHTKGYFYCSCFKGLVVKYYFWNENQQNEKATVLLLLQ